MLDSLVAWGERCEREMETPAYQMAHDRRAELFRLFPGRPWADHVDYQRLEAGDTTVGCALPPMPAMPPNAVANMSGGV